MQRQTVGQARFRNNMISNNNRLRNLQLNDDNNRFGRARLRIRGSNVRTRVNQDQQRQRRSINIERTNGQGQGRKLSDSQNNINVTSSTVLSVSGLADDISNTELRDLFSKFGSLVQCRIFFDNLGYSKGTAIVEFTKPEHAKKAVEECKNILIENVPLKVEYIMKRIGGIRRYQQKSANFRNSRN